MMRIDQGLVETIILHALRGMPKDFKNPGLFTGNAGASVLAFEVSKTESDRHKKEEYRELARLYLQSALDQLKPKDTSFSSGLTGVAFVLDYLSKTDLFELDDVTDILDQLDREIKKSVTIDIENGLYDYMYGYIGKGFYLMKREGNKRILEEIHLALKASLHDAQVPLWRDILGEKYYSHVPLFSFGLAHGVAAILYFLMKSLPFNRDQALFKSIIINAMRVIEQCQLDNEASLYPDDCISKKPSRLGWCRGDLGIANVFYFAGQLFNDPYWTKKGIDVFVHCSSRRVENSFIRTENGKIESGFCHGVAAPVHFFNSIYVRTGDPQFYEAHKYWKSILFEHFEDTKIFWQFNSEEAKWQMNSNLLQGDIGIALSSLEVFSGQRGIMSEIFLTD